VDLVELEFVSQKRRGRLSALRLWRLPKAHAWPATVLDDEHHAGGSEGLLDEFERLCLASDLDVIDRISMKTCRFGGVPNGPILTTPSPVVLYIENGQLDLNGHTFQTASGSALTIVFSGDNTGGYTHGPADNTNGPGGMLNITAPTTGAWGGHGNCLGHHRVDLHAPRYHHTEGGHR
jgi:hypothetical protein